MTNAELIECLRCENEDYGDCSLYESDCKYRFGIYCAYRQMMHDAADALEADEKRIAELEGDLLNGTISNIELIRGLRKAFTEPQQYRYCPYCGKYGIHLRCDDVEFEARGIHVKYTEIVAECSTCEQEIYIPSINDWNCENREYAYQNAKTEREENDDNLR